MVCHNYINLNMTKGTFRHMQSLKAHTSLHIHYNLISELKFLHFIPMYAYLCQKCDNKHIL